MNRKIIAILGTNSFSMAQEAAIAKIMEEESDTIVVISCNPDAISEYGMRDLKTNPGHIGHRNELPEAYKQLVLKNWEPKHYPVEIPRNKYLDKPRFNNKRR